MLLLENPVLQRELLTNLRANSAFVLLLLYQVVLGLVLLVAYPSGQRVDLSSDPSAARQLVDFFFLGQYVLASLMAPTFAAGAISGEKERKTYEMLLASPLRPWAIVIGKMVASLTHLVVLIIASLPIIMLALPLGGVSVYEVWGAYLWLMISIVLFGSIGLACSCRFQRTSSSLVVSYLVILPIVIVGAIFWRALESSGSLRLNIATLILPPIYLTISWVLCAWTARRLLYPPDVGSEGKDVVDLEEESKHAIGMIIQRDQFPDRLFAPPRRTALMKDSANPVYDKEIHAELFSQGTLMLRLVIQISMLLAIPLMAFFLFIFPWHCPWYLCYVLVFNILVAPVFSAGALTSERERQTLELLLTTVLQPWQILWGKLLAGFRVSYVLTMFLMWPMVLAFLLAMGRFGSNWLAVLTFFAIVLIAAIFNSLSALLCSTLCKKTSTALLASYSVLIVLYFLPVAAWFIATNLVDAGPYLGVLKLVGAMSPLMAVFWVPLDANIHENLAEGGAIGDWKLVCLYIASTLLAIAGMLAVVATLLRNRWGMTGR
ncbi:ABC transporter permease [Aureliella helgolandensis]|uniref:ABC-2 family transporter protein n=1 Tax=Aureliella helgolandensis TaxID=2527968 RepID=A0A518GH13_9BACT|nr:ABC transporter permease subunit [Aureliella helgolandensis]QDV27860.1 ABC-2 family transporter protein [Aureliella helgolandensis]